MHPPLVQVPIGRLSAAVLHLVPGQERAAKKLVLIGLHRAGGAVAGLVDARN